ncbi:MAG: hypothetical protein HC897_18340 [Thermoanaerobaculia bacterium]|nr:hypothetical protein [Thermoanaerobaculia bacterium]
MVSDPLELIGAVTNGGEAPVSEVEINVTLWSPDRESSIAVLAGIDKPRLGAGETSRFRIPLSRQQVDNSGFSEAFGQGQAEFSIKAQAMVEEPPEPGEEEGGEDTETDSESVN